MEKRWNIDDHLIRTVADKGGVELFVDDDRIATIPGPLLGRFAVPWRNRAVELRRVRNLDVLRSELWIEGERCPPREEDGPAAQRSSRTRCAEHGGEAVRHCRRCGEACCARCLGVDGVRCSTCFAKAGEAEVESHRRGRLFGLGLGFGLGAAALLIALLDGGTIFAQAGGGLIGITLFWLTYGLYRERKEAKQPIPLLDLPLELSDEPSGQLVGEICVHCGKAITMSKDGAWCADCRGALHGKCRRKHDCQPSSTGPDWWAMRRRAP